MSRNERVAAFANKTRKQYPTLHEKVACEGKGSRLSTSGVHYIARNDEVVGLIPPFLNDLQPQISRFFSRERCKLMPGFRAWLVGNAIGFFLAYPFG